MRHLHVFVPIEALIWIRSIAIVLLIVAHALRHVQIARPQEEPPAPAQVIEQPQFVLTPEMIDQLRQLSHAMRNELRRAEKIACQAV